MSNPFVDSRGWPVVDRLLVDAFRHQVALAGDVPVWWGTAFPPADEVPDPLDPDPFRPPAGRVMRLPGGGINAEGYQDLWRIEVLTLGRTKPESDELTTGVRQFLADLDGEDWAGVGIDRVRENEGPGRIPDVDQDVRAVPTTWGVIVRRQPRLLL